MRQIYLNAMFVLSGLVCLSLWDCARPLPNLQGFPCERDEQCGPVLRCLSGQCRSAEAIQQENPTGQEPATQEPATQEPTTQEPATQEPTTQEPASTESGQEPASTEPGQEIVSDDGDAGSQEPSGPDDPSQETPPGENSEQPTEPTIEQGPEPNPDRTCDPNQPGCCIPNQQAKQWTGLPTAAISSLAFSPSGNSMAVGGAANGVRLWDLRGATTPTSLATLNSHNGHVTALAFDGNGQRLATASLDKSAILWNLSQGSGRSFSHNDEVHGVVFPSGGREFVAADKKGQISVWRLVNNKLDRRISPSTVADLTTLASRGSSTLATGHVNGDIRFWRTDSSQAQGVISNAHGDSVQSLSFHPTRSLLASASLDGTIKLWNATTRQPVHTVHTGISKAYAVRFSPQGHWLIASFEDGRVLLWDTNVYNLRATLNAKDGEVRGLGWSSNGRSIAAGDKSGTVTIWSCP